MLGGRGALYNVDAHSAVVQSGRLTLARLHVTE